MYYIIQDDGTAYGPFDTKFKAVYADVEAMSFDALEPYLSVARSLIKDEWTDADYAAAKELVVEVDHAVVAISIEVGVPLDHESSDPYELLFGIAPISGETLLQRAEAWAR